MNNKLKEASSALTEKDTIENRNKFNKVYDEIMKKGCKIKAIYILDITEKPSESLSNALDKLMKTKFDDLSKEQQSKINDFLTNENDEKTESFQKSIKNAYKYNISKWVPIPIHYGMTRFMLLRTLLITLFQTGLIEDYQLINPSAWFMNYPTLNYDYVDSFNNIKNIFYSSGDIEGKQKEKIFREAIESKEGDELTQWINTHLNAPKLSTVSRTDPTTLYYLPPRPDMKFLPKYQNEKKESFDKTDQIILNDDLPIRLSSTVYLFCGIDCFKNLGGEIENIPSNTLPLIKQFFPKIRKMNEFKKREDWNDTEWANLIIKNAQTIRDVYKLNIDNLLVQNNQEQISYGGVFTYSLGVRKPILPSYIWDIFKPNKQIPFIRWKDPALRYTKYAVNKNSIQPDTGEVPQITANQLDLFTKQTSYVFQRGNGYSITGSKKALTLFYNWVDVPQNNVPLEGVLESIDNNNVEILANSDFYIIDKSFIVDDSYEIGKKIRFFQPQSLFGIIQFLPPSKSTIDWRLSINLYNPLARLTKTTILELEQKSEDIFKDLLEIIKPFQSNPLNYIYTPELATSKINQDTLYCTSIMRFNVPKDFLRINYEDTRTIAKSWFTLCTFIEPSLIKDTEIEVYVGPNSPKEVRLPNKIWQTGKIVEIEETTNDILITIKIGSKKAKISRKWVRPLEKDQKQYQDVIHLNWRETSMYSKAFGAKDLIIRLRQQSAEEDTIIQRLMVEFEMSTDEAINTYRAFTSDARRYNLDRVGTDIWIEYNQSYYSELENGNNILEIPVHFDTIHSQAMYDRAEDFVRRLICSSINKTKQKKQKPTESTEQSLQKEKKKEDILEEEEFDEDLMGLEDFLDEQSVSEQASEQGGEQAKSQDELKEIKDELQEEADELLFVREGSLSINPLLKALYTSDSKVFKWEEKVGFESFSKHCQGNSRYPKVFSEQEFINQENKFPKALTNKKDEDTLVCENVDDFKEVIEDSTGKTYTRYKVCHVIKTGSSKNTQDKKYYGCPRIYDVRERVALRIEDLVFDEIEGKSFEPKGNDKDDWRTDKNTGKDITEYNPKYKGRGPIPASRSIPRPNESLFLMARGKNYTIPGFLSPELHPDGIYMPCCFSRKAENKDGIIEPPKYLIDGLSVDIQDKISDIREDSYISNWGRPLSFRPYRLGILPIPLHERLNPFLKSYRGSHRSAIPKKSNGETYSIWLRRGNRRGPLSFLEAINSIYIDYKGESKKHSVYDLIDLIIKNITESEFYLLGSKIVASYIHMHPELSAYQNFIEGLMNYNPGPWYHLIKLLCSPKNWLFPKGLKLIICQVSSDGEITFPCIPVGFPNSSPNNSSPKAMLIYFQSHFENVVFLPENGSSSEKVFILNKNSEFDHLIDYTYNYCSQSNDKLAIENRSLVRQKEQYKLPEINYLLIKCLQVYKDKSKKPITHFLLDPNNIPSFVLTIDNIILPIQEIKLNNPVNDYIFNEGKIEQKYLLDVLNNIELPSKEKLQKTLKKLNIDGYNTQYNTKTKTFYDGIFTVGGGFIPHKIDKEPFDSKLQSIDSLTVYFQNFLNAKTQFIVERYNFKDIKEKLKTIKDSEPKFYENSKKDGYLLRLDKYIVPINIDKSIDKKDVKKFEEVTKGIELEEIINNQFEINNKLGKNIQIDVERVLFNKTQKANQKINKLLLSNGEILPLQKQFELNEKYKDTNIYILSLPSVRRIIQNNKFKQFLGKSQHLEEIQKIVFDDKIFKQLLFSIGNYIQDNPDILDRFFETNDINLITEKRENVKNIFSEIINNITDKRNKGNICLTFEQDSSSDIVGEELRKDIFISRFSELFLFDKKMQEFILLGGPIPNYYSDRVIYASERIEWDDIMLRDADGNAFMAYEMASHIIYPNQDLMEVVKLKDLRNINNVFSVESKEIKDKKTKSKEELLEIEEIFDKTYKLSKNTIEIDNLNNIPIFVSFLS